MEAQTKALPEGGVENKSGDDDNDLLLIQLITQLPVSLPLHDAWINDFVYSFIHLHTFWEGLLPRTEHLLLASHLVRYFYTIH